MRVCVGGWMGGGWRMGGWGSRVYIRTVRVRGQFRMRFFWLGRGVVFCRFIVIHFRGTRVKPARLLPLESPVKRHAQVFRRFLPPLSARAPPAPTNEYRPRPLHAAAGQRPLPRPRLPRHSLTWQRLPLPVAFLRPHLRRRRPARSARRAGVSHSASSARRARSRPGSSERCQPRTIPRAACTRSACAWIMRRDWRGAWVSSQRLGAF